MNKTILTAVCITMLSASAYAAGTLQRRSVVETTPRFERLTQEEQAKALLQGGVPRESIYRGDKLEVARLAEFRQSLRNVDPALIRASNFDLSQLSSRAGQSVIALFEKVTKAGTNAVNGVAQLMRNARIRGYNSPAQQALLVTYAEILENPGVDIVEGKLVENQNDLAKADDATLKGTIIPMARALDKKMEAGVPAEQAAREAFIETKVAQGLTREQAEKGAKEAKGCFFGIQ